MDEGKTKIPKPFCFFEEEEAEFSKTKNFHIRNFKARRPFA